MSSLPIEVVCAGIVIADCVARPVRQLPQRGQLALVDEISLQLGGSAANTGTQLVRLGSRVALAGRIGNDSFGQFLRSKALQLGCETTDITVDEKAPSSATIVQVDPAGERTFLHSLGANAFLSAADFPLEGWARRGAKVLHVAGFHILPRLEPQVPELFGRATELGLTTSLDCVWDASGQWTQIRAALPCTDLFCPSLSEAQQITGKDAPEQVAVTLFELGVRRVVALKMGEHGSLVQARGQPPVYLTAPQVTALDGTGAGDAFIAGFLAGYLRGLGWTDAARLGNAAGGLCTQVLGGCDGLTNFDDTWKLAQTLPERGPA